MSKSVILSLFLWAVGAFAFLGCSHQWREASPEHSTAAVLAMLDEVSSGQGQSLSVTAQFREGSLLYFADAPSSLGGVASLLSFSDLGFLGLGSGLSWHSVYRARVFVFDRPSGLGRELGMLIGVDLGQGFSYVEFLGHGSVENGEFVAQMSGNGAAFEVRSFDVIDGELADVIQFKVYQGGQFIGQFSTLVAYSQ